MAVVNPPYVLQNTSHPALLFRRALSGLLSEGICKLNGDNDLLVKPDGGLILNVSRGGCFVRGTDITDQGLYFCYNDSDKRLEVSASDLTNPRIDLVIARVRDAFHGSAGDDWLLDIVSGTPTASPTEPTLPDSSLRLAKVTVPANASEITNVDDVRTPMSQVDIPDNSVGNAQIVSGAISTSKFALPALFSHHLNLQRFKITPASNISLNRGQSESFFKLDFHPGFTPFTLVIFTTALVLVPAKGRSQLNLLLNGVKQESRAIINASLKTGGFYGQMSFTWVLNDVNITSSIELDIQAEVVSISDQDSPSTFVKGGSEMIVLVLAG